MYIVKRESRSDGMCNPNYAAPPLRLDHPLGGVLLIFGCKLNYNLVVPPLLPADTLASRLIYEAAFIYLPDDDVEHSCFQLNTLQPREFAK